MLLLFEILFFIPIYLFLFIQKKLVSLFVCFFAFLKKPRNNIHKIVAVFMFPYSMLSSFSTV